MLVSLRFDGKDKVCYLMLQNSLHITYMETLTPSCFKALRFGIITMLNLQVDIRDTLYFCLLLTYILINLFILFKYEFH